jgi:predicted transcriptional regulator
MDIIANVLQAADGGARETRILYQCNLSLKQLHAYLDFLVEMGFLERFTLKTQNQDDCLLFKMTSKGKAFIKAYLNLRAL